VVKGKKNGKALNQRGQTHKKNCEAVDKANSSCFEARKNSVTKKDMKQGIEKE
jgi:hypothetical protein